MRDIVVEVAMSVPDEASDEDIQAYLDVEIGGYNSMKSDNPCKDKTVVHDVQFNDD